MQRCSRVDNRHVVFPQICRLVMRFVSWFKSVATMCSLTRWCNVSTGMVALSGVVYELACRVRLRLGLRLRLRAPR